MVLSTRAIGTMAWLLGKENSSISTGTYMKDTGRTTRLTGKESTSMRRERDMKATGRMISSMASESKSGMRVVNMKVDTQWGRKRVKANTHGQMVPHTAVNG